jgi:hypothetical protein
MNDDELLTAVRAQRDKVPMTTPVDQIISRGRSVRARRRLPGIGGALALAAGAALAVTALLPTSHQPGQAVSAHLAAWTVAKHANGDIYVTIHQLKNPAGLQSTLRADGLPVTVSFSGPPLSTSCQPYDTSKDVLRAVAQFNQRDGNAYLVIHPSALPSNVGVSIFDDPGALPSGSHPRAQGSGSPPPAGITGPLAIGLVHASQRCTG